MKKLLRSLVGASKGAALIIVLALMVLVTIYNVERAMATSDTACKFITIAQIVNAGSSYVVGDNLAPAYGNLCSPADNYGFRLQVASVNSSGGVTAVTIIQGIGYSAPPSNPIGFGGSATGTGFTANCTFQ
jgi:hypothetical protein